MLRTASISFIKRNAMRIVPIISLIAVFSGCDNTQESTCEKTVRTFMVQFNNQNFQDLGRLYKPDALSSSQYRRIRKNLDYVRTVAGSIKSMEFKEQQADQLLYRSYHENTTMNVVFQLDESCNLVSYLFNTYYPDDLPLLERNQTILSLPFNGDWYVEWGGNTIEQNYHNAHRNMQGAIDFTIRDSEGKMFEGQGKNNKDYYAFGKEIIAPAEATVVKVIDGIQDNKVDRPNEFQTYGNAIILKTALNEYVLMAHLMENSMAVQEGQLVQKGDLLALCGNSGFSKKPHLHFIVQNVPDLFHPTGATCFFDSIVVNGQLKTDYSPVRADQVSNGVTSQ